MYIFLTTNIGPVKADDIPVVCIICLHILVTSLANSASSVLTCVEATVHFLGLFREQFSLLVHFHKRRMFGKMIWAVKWV